MTVSCAMRPTARSRRSARVGVGPRPPPVSDYRLPPPWQERRHPPSWCMSALGSDWSGPRSGGDERPNTDHKGRPESCQAAIKRGRAAGRAGGDHQASRGAPIGRPDVAGHKGLEDLLCSPVRRRRPCIDDYDRSIHVPGRPSRQTLYLGAGTVTAARRLDGYVARAVEPQSVISAEGASLPASSSSSVEVTDKKKRRCNRATSSLQPAGATLDRETRQVHRPTPAP